MNKNWIWIALWLGVIFWFSHQPGLVTRKHSGFVLELFSIIGIPLHEWTGELATWIIRKSAHFTEFLVLMILILRAGVHPAWALLWVFSFANLDEWHQVFIPGRTGAWQDVLIDCLGGIVGCWIFFAFNKRKNSI